VRRFIPFIAILVLPLTGCKPAGKALTSLQYHNIRWRLVKTTMTMTVGDGSVDARKLMEQETYVGGVTQGRVTAEYPQGLEKTAGEIAKEFDEFYPAVQKELGVEWSFDLVLKLVPAPPYATGYRYSVVLPKNRRVVFPIIVSGDNPNAWWAPVVAHEMTEASMLAPKKRSKVALGDLYSGSLCLSMGTRWFRDGAADYAEYMFERLENNAQGTRYHPPGSVYAELNGARENLLSWTNCEGQPNWYAAASGLIFEMKNRYGDDAVVRQTRELSKTSTPDGRGLKRAFKRATGDDLKAFLKSYETPWAGFVVHDTNPNPNLPHSVFPGNRAQVGTVYPATPASRRGVRYRDRIVEFEGQPVTSADELETMIARKRPWDIVSIRIERDGQLMPMKLKLIPRPVDIKTFLELSGVTPGT
jgi:hypothetical protein